MKVEMKTWGALGLATALMGAGLAGCAGESGEAGENGETAQTAEAGEAGEGEGGHRGAPTASISRPCCCCMVRGALLQHIGGDYTLLY